MTDAESQSLLAIPTVYEIPALAGSIAQPQGYPISIAAEGGSVFNNGAVAIFLSSTTNPLDANAIELEPGGTIPWPSGVPCWVWAAAGSVTAGQCFVMPIQLPYSPGGLGGQPVTIVNMLLNMLEELYTISTVPSVLSGDHPPNEMQSVFYSGTTSGILVAAPGAGYRIRLFRAELVCATIPTVGPNEYVEIQWTKHAVTNFVLAGQVADNTDSFVSADHTEIPLTGLPLDENTAINFYTNSAGNIGPICRVYYTVEAI